MKCPKCNVELVEKRGVAKTGKPYHFFGCPNYPTCTHTEQVEGTKGGNEEVMDGLRKVYAKIEAIETKLDDYFNR